MTVQWVANIRCSIDEGKAHLSSEYSERLGCKGECYSCTSFLGVDPTDVGRDEYKSCCEMISSVRKAA